MTDPIPPPVSSVRGHIGAASASTSDLLDLLTTALAEDDRHTTTDHLSTANHAWDEDDEQDRDRADHLDGGGSR